MTNILDQVARSSSAARYGQFQPSDQREYFALRLAQKLDDEAAARHYGELLEHYSEAQLLAAYRSEEHTSELQSLTNLVCRLLLEKKKNIKSHHNNPHPPTHQSKQLYESSSI